MTRTGLSPLAWLDEVERHRRAAGLRRSLRTRPPVGAELDLASNDYLGLSQHPAVIDGGVAALRTWGAGSTGSRLVTGNTEIHEGFERALADFVGAESALVFSSGYTANLGAVVALSGAGSLLVSDALTHASLVDACRLSRARVVVTPHRDVAAVDAALAARDEERAVVVTDSVFSADGVLAPLRALHEVCRRHGALLIVDEAHGLGVRGDGGRGLLNEIRACRCARHRDDDDAVKSLGQPGRRGSRPRASARPPHRRGAAVHLRYRPRAGRGGRSMGGAGRADRRTMAGPCGFGACRGARIDLLRDRAARFSGGVGDSR